MAIIHVLTEQADRHGGAGVYMAELVRRLADRGHRLDLVCHHAARDLEEVCAVHRLPVGRAADRPSFWRLGAALRPAAYRQEISALGLTAPDVVLGTSPSLIWAHRRLFPRPPLVYAPYGLVLPQEIGLDDCTSKVQRGAAVRALHQLERAALRRAVRTVRFTRGGCAALVGHYGRDVARRFRILAAPVLLPEKPSVIDPAAPLRLLSIGRLVEARNLDFLIRSLARLTHPDWTLDVIGDGDQRPLLEKEVRYRRLQGRVVFHGHQSDVERWFQSASLFLLASRQENSGLTVLDAMSYGVPALALRPDGRHQRNLNHELMDHGRDGFLADDETHFARQLGDLLRHPARLVEAGRLARRRVAHRHRWDDHVDEYEAIIAQVRRRRCTRESL